MKRVIVVPARQGSVRLKDKNLRLYKGKPLLRWALEKAYALRADGSIPDDVVVLTTDYNPDELVEAEVFHSYYSYDPEDALHDITINLGEHDYFSLLRDRPSWLATEEASMLHTVADAVSCANAKPDDLVIVVYPTFPSFSAEEIEKAVALLRQWPRGGIVGGYTPTEHPALVYPAKDFSLYSEKDFLQEPKNVIGLDASRYYRCQDYPTFPDERGWCVVSHAICVFYVKTIHHMNNQMLSSDMLVYPIEKPVDIDYQEDLDG